MDKKRKPKNKKYADKKCPYCGIKNVVAYGKVKKPEGPVQRFKCINPDCSRKKTGKTGVYFTEETDKTIKKHIFEDKSYYREYEDKVKRSIKKRYFISLLLEIMEASKSDTDSLIYSSADANQESRKNFRIKIENQEIASTIEKNINCFEPKLIICKSKINNTLKIIKIDGILNPEDKIKLMHSLEHKD